MYSECLQLVREALAASAVAVDGSVDGMACWIAEIDAWNRRIDLTAARDARELVDLMIADAAILAQHISPGARVVDIGTGAGAPGLALSLLRPDLALTLVEPLQKRCAFLRATIGTLKKAGIERRVEVVRGRGEDVAGGAGGVAFARHDVAISRATLAPPAWLELGLRLAPEVWVLLAREGAPSRDDCELMDEFAYRWPLTGAERRAARYRHERA